MIDSILDLLRCPLCGGRLSRRGGSLVCPAGHCHDVARQGYVNFAPHHRDAFYTKALFESRARVLGAGLFAPAMQALTEALDRYAPGESPVVVDAGCGEGAYIRGVCPGRAMTRVGFDLSRDAVRMAAAADKNAAFFVCDIARIPLADGCADAVLDVFTPANYAEFGRILKPGGVALKLAPRAGYLTELREAAGARLRREARDGDDVAEHAARHMDMLEERTLRWRASVTPELLADVARMTPMLAGLDVGTLDLSGIDGVTLEETLYVGRIKDA